MPLRNLLVLVAMLGVASADLYAQSPEKGADSIVPKEALVLPAVGQTGRSPVHKDDLEAAIIAGRFQPPKAGDALAQASGKKVVWQKITPEKDGLFRHSALRGGYAYFNVPSDTERVMMLEAAGHALVYVNGELRGEIHIAPATSICLCCSRKVTITFYFREAAAR